MNIFQLIARLFTRTESGKKAENPVSPEMRSALTAWMDMYRYSETTPNNSRSLNLPSAISSEFVRLVMAESVIRAQGNSARAEFLDAQLQRFTELFAVYRAETAFALGSMAFKPYVSGDRILVDAIRADRFVPTAFDDADRPTAAIFLARKVLGHSYYTRLESHSWDAAGKTYTVENRAYHSLSADSLGSPCSLESVPGWESLAEMQVISNIEAPLFAVFRMPCANYIDPDSPVGISCFAKAADLIDEANAQWARIQWEFKGTELAVDADERLFHRDKNTRERLEMPVGNKRLFRRFSVREDKLSESMQVFSPAIRDSSLFNGLNHILQRIEFNVGLAYGTLSEPSDIEKTATEVESSKQRSYVQVCRMQKALQTAFEGLLYAMEVYADLYELAPSGDVSLSCTWGDSVLEDTDKEFQRRLQLVTAGKLRAEKLLSWYFGFDEDDAETMAEYLPDESNDGGLFSEDEF